MAKQASPATKARLALVLKALGADAFQPAAAVMALPWVQAVLSVNLSVLWVAMRQMGGGTTGVDYGPLSKTVCQYVVINWLNRYPSPDGIWALASQGKAVAPVPKAGKQTRRSPSVAPQPVAQPVPAVPAAAPAPQSVLGGSVPPVAQPVVQPPVQPIVPPAPDVVIPVVTPPEMKALPLMVGVCPAEQEHPEWNWQDADKVFAVPGLKGRVAVWPKVGEDGVNGNTPKIDPHFKWHFNFLQWAVFYAGEYPAKGAWLWGNRATGKTSFAQQFAARTGRPFFKITFSETMEPSEFLGDKGAQNGSSVFQYGTMLIALTEATPSVILLDEISQARAGHITGPLNEIVHPDCSFRIPSTGKRIDFNPSHIFVAADNTNGTGDTTSMYEGAKMMNRSTMDRFGYFFAFTFLPKAQEVEIIMDRARCDVAIAEKVWGVLHALRAKVTASEATDPPSIREATAFAAALRAGFDAEEAFEASFVAKYPQEMQEDMRVTYTAAFNAAP